MKKILLILISTITNIHIILAQTNNLPITIKVVDEQTMMPLENVIVKINEQENNVALTDEFGIVILKRNTTTINITCSKIRYKTRILNYVASDSNFLLITLFQKPLALEAVTITAPTYSQSNKVSSVDLLLRPLNSAQDALRNVPGLIIAQHAGGGKAEQIFLRGYDIDHGTDINITVDGLPVNMISHAHGQGYADLHFLIPETIEKVIFDKGPYQADKGNLATAGYVAFTTKNTIENNAIKIEAGNYNTQRIFSQFKLLNHSKKNRNQQLYLATEINKSNGYFESNQNFYRGNVFAKYHLQKNNNHSINISAATFKSKWDASGQIPERAIKDGSISRFGAIDNTEGGNTERTNISFQSIRKTKQDITVQQNAFLSKYKFNLYSNFTFFLEDTTNGDVINQYENRTIIGYNIIVKKKYSLQNKIGIQEIGAGIRYDDIADIHLAKAPKRTITEYLQRGALREANYFAYYNNQLNLTSNLTINGAVRYDYFSFAYKNKKEGQYNFDQNSKGIVSPKLNVIYNVKNNLQFFIKNGIGFHSNDARVVLNNTIPFSLPKVFSTDIGANILIAKKLYLQASIWHIYSQQEFVYVGDAGIVEPSGKARRLGFDVVGRYQFNKWLFADVDISYAKARAIEEQKGNDYIPLAPKLSSIGGLTANFKNGFQAAIRYRYLGNRPANSDNTLIAKGYTLLDGVFNYKIKKYEFSVTMENILNTKWNETQFETTSKLRHEANPITEIHLTPGSPLFIKAGIKVSF